MCSKPKIPKPPDIKEMIAPPPAEETADQVQRSGLVRSRDSRTTLQRFDLRLPPNFQIPRR